MGSHRIGCEVVGNYGMRKTEHCELCDSKPDQLCLLPAEITVADREQLKQLPPPLVLLWYTERQRAREAEGG